MEVTISESLIEKAQAILDSDKFEDRAEISLGQNGPVAILTTDPDSIMSLYELKHNNQSYYLGLPKE